MPLWRRRQLPAVLRDAAAAGGTPVRRVAMASEGAHPPPAPGARRLPPVEHPVSRGRGLHRTRPLPRRVGRAGRRRHLPQPELPLLLAAALGAPGGRFRDAVAALLGAVSGAFGRPRDPRGRGAVSCLARARHGEPGVVPGARRWRAPQALRLRAERARRRALRALASERLLPRMSFAVWLTGLSGSGKSAVTRELLMALKIGRAHV